MRIRLKEACYFGGRLCEVGEIVTLPEGMKGPHRAVQKTIDKIDYGTNPPIDANRILGNVVDVPLYDELPDEPERHSDEQKSAADSAGQVREEMAAREPVPVPEVPPSQSQQPGELRTLTHVEERERRWSVDLDRPTRKDRS